MSIDTDRSSNIVVGDNRHKFDMSLSGGLFLYEIHYACKNTDDCARDWITKATNEILPRQLNISAIVNELIPLLLNSSPTANNAILECYDSNSNISKCGTAEQHGVCFITHSMETGLDSIKHQCIYTPAIKLTSVSIFQSDYSANFYVGCNRSSLCNDNSTLKAVKKLMFEYNVTATLDGRLVDKEFIRSYGLKLMASISLTAMMILIAF